MCPSGGHLDKCWNLSHLQTRGHTNTCRRNSDPVKVKDRTPGSQPDLLCALPKPSPHLCYQWLGLEALLESSRASFCHCSESLASLLQRKASLPGFSQVSGRHILILIDNADYSPKCGSNKHKRASLFSVSEADMDNVRVNPRLERVESAQLRQDPLRPLEWGILPPNWACGLATRVSTSIFHSSAPSPSFTGTWPNITRNAIVNCAEMVTYDIIKEKLLDYHLLTGEALGSIQGAALPQQEGNPEFHRVGTIRGNWVLEEAERGAVPSKNAQYRSASLLDRWGAAQFMTHLIMPVRSLKNAQSIIVEPRTLDSSPALPTVHL